MSPEQSLLSSPEKTSPNLGAEIARNNQRPDKFVRESSLMHFGEGFPEQDEVMAVRDAELERLRAHGLNVSRPEFLGMRTDTTTPRPHTTVVEVADRVMGPELDLAMIDKLPGLDADKLSRHYLGLLDYLKEVYGRGGYYMSDVTRENRQSLYGHTASDLEDKIHLIDVGPNLEELHLDQPDHPDNAQFERNASLLIWTIKFANDRGYDVVDVLAQAREFYDQVKAR
jgi:hypothetical protein